MCEVFGADAAGVVVSRFRTQMWSGVEAREFISPP